MSIKIDYSSKVYQAEDRNGDYYPVTYHIADITGDDSGNNIDGLLTLRYMRCEDVTIHGGAGNDTIGGTAEEYCQVDGGSGDDLIFIDTRQNRDFYSAVTGGEGIDTFAFKPPSNGGISANLATCYATAGWAIHVHIYDIENIKGADFNDTLTGNQFANQINGGTGNDWIDGGAGSDSLFGDAGNDTMIGGGGSDQLFGGAGDDRFIAGTDNASFDGGSGRDTLDYSQNDNLNLNVDLASGIVTRMQNGAFVGIDTVNDIENIIGAGGSDLMLGTLPNDKLYGNAGNDTIKGMAGNDILIGGEGNDIVTGGAGNDVIGLDGGGDDVFIFDRSLGRDLIINLSSANASGFDVVQFNDVSTNEIVFQRAGKDLQIAIADNSKAITIVNWFSIVSDATHPNALAIDQFAAGDVVLDADIVNVALAIIGEHPVSMASLLPASVV